MQPDENLSPWEVSSTRCIRANRIIIERDRAPLCRVLPYRRSCGAAPYPTERASHVIRHGALLSLDSRALGDTLLALSVAVAVSEISGDRTEMAYEGPWAKLMERCTLNWSVRNSKQLHRIIDRSGAGLTYQAQPETTSQWADILDERLLEIHAALPMRYYLEIERISGVRLQQSFAPLPKFRSKARRDRHHVVFVTATSLPDRKNYGHRSFEKIAESLALLVDAPWRFTLITGRDDASTFSKMFTSVSSFDATDCVDIFASAEIVLGNDTGLTHLAALSTTEEGESPHVVGLYGRHSYSKWITGLPNHHAIATPFSQMLSASDQCPVRDGYDDSVWMTGALSDAISVEQAVNFSRHIAGW